MSIERHDKGARMSQAVVHGDTIYLAGQVGEGGNVTEETQDILGSIDSLLARCGSDKSRLLSATIWLTDMDDFQEMNAVWDAWVDPDNPPARACVESKRLAASKFHVEIMAVAATGP